MKFRFSAKVNPFVVVQYAFCVVWGLCHGKGFDLLPELRGKAIFGRGSSCLVFSRLPIFIVLRIIPSNAPKGVASLGALRIGFLFPFSLAPKDFYLWRTDICGC
jgi:hypothetical protein